MDSLIVFMADVLVVPVVLLSMFFILKLPPARRWQAIGRGIIVAVTALWFAKLASLMYQGVRPFVELGVDPKASYLANPGFPSDHALLVFAASFVVLAATGNRKAALLLFSLAALVAIGRVMALVHSPMDVIGGFLCAAIAAVLWYGLSLRQTYYAPKSV